MIKVEREFIFSEADFRRISKLIYDRAGISLSPAKMEMVYSRLARRLRTRGCQSFAQYLDLLGQGGHDEWSAFIGALTTHMTSFFREQHHFPILAAHLARQRHLRGGRINLWSCAASTGEEPYSMAITAAETFNSLSPPVTILASDVDKEVLTEASEGIYPLERVSQLPQQVVRRYFERGCGTNSGWVRVRPELRRMVIFQTMNLAASVWPVKEAFDAIFCRNVMIYFDCRTQKRILQHCRNHLKPDGLYFAGHSENLSFAEHLFAPCGQTVYRPHSPGRMPPEQAGRPEREDRAAHAA